MDYFDDFETEPIGDGNPYYRCISCKRSVPEINGYIERHLETCEYRIKKEKELTNVAINYVRELR